MPVEYQNTENETNIGDNRALIPAIVTGVKCRCPNCGEGRLFGKFLKVVPACQSCGEDYTHERADDLPPYLTIVIVGHIVVTLLMIVEAKVDLSLITHLALWIPLTVMLTFALMQPVKGGVVGLQWAARMFGFGTGYEPR